MKKDVFFEDCSFLYVSRICTKSKVAGNHIKNKSSRTERQIGLPTTYKHFYSCKLTSGLRYEMKQVGLFRQVTYVCYLYEKL